jgi:hypothetical protein
MSHINTSKTNFTDRVALENALMDLLLTKDREAITSEHFMEGAATDLNGTSINSEFYISRKVLGTSYGDIGFTKNKEGSYDIIADTGYDYVNIADTDKSVSIKEFQARLNARYSEQTISSVLPEIEQQGYVMERTLQEDGNIVLTFTKTAQAYAY